MGGSDAGRQLAAETAEVVLGASCTLPMAKTYYVDVKGRTPELGRDPNHMKNPAGAFLIVGDTVKEARAIRPTLDSLVHYDSVIA